MAQSMTRVQKEVVLHSAAHEELSLEVHHGNLRIHGRFSDFDRQRIVILVDTPEDVHPGAEVDVYFGFRDSVMTFRSLVEDRAGDRVFLQTPEAVYRQLQRGYERVQPPEGTEVELYVSGQQYNLNFPRLGESQAAEPPEVSAGFDPASIADLLKSFRKRASKIAAEHKIVMFRSRAPQGFEERVVSMTGKTVLLPLSYRYRYEATGVGPRMVDRAELLELESQGKLRLSAADSPAVAGSAAQSPDSGETGSIDKEGSKQGAEEKRRLEARRETVSVLQALKRAEAVRYERGILCELYCPIIFQRYVVGYIYLLRGLSRGHAQPFDPTEVEFVHQFSRILAYALQVNGYFKTEPVQREIRGTELIDMSASGVLFAVSGSARDSIGRYMESKVVIRFPGQSSIEATGRVMRLYQGAGITYVAVHFTAMEPDDFERLFLVLYGDQYRGDADFTLSSRPSPVDTEA